ncbi:MAG: class I SAM-dependent rRNA methyltransferase [bacterium]|nr:class I SAM-dependent rRNA methyltransferase [bacterium]
MQGEFPALASLPEANERNVTVRVDRSGQRALRKRHPWLFESGIREQSHEGRPGDLAVVFDRARKFLAIGLYDPGSPIRVRVLHAGKPTPIDASFFSRRFAELAARRADLQRQGTDAYRLVNGDNEGMAGLVVDRYAQTLVVKLYTPAWLPHLRSALHALLQVTAAERVVLRLSRDVSSRTSELYGLADGTLIYGAELDGPLTFQENGLRFECDPVRGQKTGFFLDQRDNRSRLETLVRGGELLNAFSYTGGFSLYAARGGARNIISLDQSAPALAASERNFALNRSDTSIATAKHQTMEADVFEALPQMQDAGRRFDALVIDPPALAKRQDEVDRARAAYARLVANGVALLRPGGLLVMASCSARIDRESFFELVHRAAHDSGRPIDELARATEPIDHPVGFSEGAYLKCLFARVR